MSKEKKNVPTNPGFYWGKTSGYKWWNLFIKVEGESPFFICLATNLSSGKHGRIEAWDVEEWGPEIPDPDK